MVIIVEFHLDEYIGVAPSSPKDSNCPKQKVARF
jgi:hypothetical protein